MAASPNKKKSKNSVKGRAAKRAGAKTGKRQPVRGSEKGKGKSLARRSRRAATRGDAVKTPAKRTRGSLAESPSSSLARASLGREPERKPLKKAEPRPNRPPAVLPIPQSTFFF
jgi:hypothetical protein